MDIIIELSNASCIFSATLDVFQEAVHHATNTTNGSSIS
jgi:hypothetical protein